MLSRWSAQFTARSARMCLRTVKTGLIKQSTYTCAVLLLAEISSNSCRRSAIFWKSCFAKRGKNTGPNHSFLHFQIGRERCPLRHRLDNYAYSLDGDVKIRRYLQSTHSHSFIVGGKGGWPSIISTIFIDPLQQMKRYTLSPTIIGCPIPHPIKTFLSSLPFNPKPILG